MSVFFLIVLLAAVVGTAGMVAVSAWIIGRLRSLESGGGADTAALREQVRRLEDELLVVQDEMTRLRETVEFTEKLLSAPDDESPEDDGAGSAADRDA